MRQVLPSESRGAADHGWLQSRHTFSFAGYFNPQRMGFRNLRVLNDDRVAPGGGFGTHPHQDMEIVSYVVSGALRHRDSMGNESVIRPGEVQRMSAGTGVRHSEYNDSTTQPVRFLQIWIPPTERGLPPSYEQRDFGAERNGTLRLVASPDGAEDSLTLHADARLYSAVLAPGDVVEHRFDAERRGWLQVVEGTVRVDGHELAEGDALALADEPSLILEAVADANVLLFDLP